MDMKYTLLRNKIKSKNYMRYVCQVHLLICEIINNILAGAKFKGAKESTRHLLKSLLIKYYNLTVCTENELNYKPPLKSGHPYKPYISTLQLNNTYWGVNYKLIMYK